jgi:hypothetical protein
MSDNPFVGTWIYRSLYNDPNFKTDFDKLEFGRAYLVIEEAAQDILTGTIGDSDPSFPWSLKLQGSRQYGAPNRARFQGVGVVNGSQWIYDYECYLVPQWPNGVDQRPALVGSVVRTIPHPGSGPNTVNPAGVVASFYAARAD